MPEQSVIVWDLETIPDLAAAARMLDLGHAPEAEVREALGSGFPKHPLHKIVCIGALVATRQPEGWRIEALGAPHIGERTANNDSHPGAQFNSEFHSLVKTEVARLAAEKELATGSVVEAEAQCASCAALY